MGIVHGHLSNGKAIYGFQLQRASLGKRRNSNALEALCYHDLSKNGVSRAGYSNKNGKGFGVENPTTTEMDELRQWAYKNIRHWN